MNECCACDSTDNLTLWDDDYWCAKCKSIQEETLKNIEEQHKADSHIPKEIMERQLQVDQSIKISADLFNADTVSIHDLEEAIKADDTIENKNYELAKRIGDRIKSFSQAIFDIDKKRLELTSAQRASQEYINNLSNKLRDDERAELRLRDLTYKPVPSKKPSKPKTKKSRFDKAHKEMLRTIAGSLDVPEFTLQQICIQRNCNPIEAGEYLKSLMPPRE